MNQKVRELAAAVADPNARQWVNWRYEKRSGEEKPTKVPKLPSGNGNAKPNDPATWSTLDEVLDAASQMDRALDGIGVMFSKSKMLLGIDIDGCVVDGEVSSEIAAIIEKARSYTELSPSKKGLHIYLKLSTPLTLERKRSGHFECYTEGRWFTFTGNEWKNSYPVRTMTPEEALEVLKMMGYPWRKEKSPEKKDEAHHNPPAIPRNELTTLSDADILQKMFASKNGAAIKALYEGDISAYGGDDSKADAALCSHLAFWTGRDPARMLSLWLNSPLGAREKTQQRQDYRDSTIAFTIENCVDVYTEKQEGIDSDPDGDDVTQATQLVELVANNPDVELFRDEHRTAFVRLPIGDHKEIWACKSSQFKFWLAKTFYERFGRKAPSGNTISTALNVLLGKAAFDGREYKLHNRVAEHEGAIWYDLGDQKWRAVRIAAAGWDIVDDTPILFRRYRHQQAQPDPVVGGSVADVLKYVNVTNDDQKLLLLVFLVSCLMPGFPHPIPYIYGVQGSAKSTLAAIVRILIDPSTTGPMHLRNNTTELVQILAHHWLVFFDNVSKISPEIADLFCRAVTGTGHSKRELYTDDDDVLYHIMTCIGINGINIVSLQPDLLERSILFELQPISKDSRREQAALMREFEQQRAHLLGALLTAVSKALEILPTVQLVSSPRMADFTRRGCAIAVALGYTQEEFLAAYDRNINSQNDEVLGGHVEASLIADLMADRSEWSGTATELLEALKAHAHGEDSWTLAKDGHALRMKLNTLKTNLTQSGIDLEFHKTRSKRSIVIQKRDVGSEEPTTSGDLFDSKDAHESF